ncbi:MAG: L,D-transpeptidase [Chloroflexi bacterium]|nr:L,D-transpeptidase [Chloroflexota bacterium]
MEVDLEHQLLRLHEGQQVIATFAAATGVPGDPPTPTTPGMYRVVEKEKGPIENVAGVFVADIILFDRLNGVGLRSIPMDAAGKILDSRRGQPITAGCVRVGNSSAVFEFAEVGMWAFVR